MRTIDIPPGVVQVASRKANTSNWRETHLVRWEGNTMLPFAGWEEIDYPAFGSKLRVIHKWVDNSGQTRVAFLCEEHAYVDSGDGVLNDITPDDGIAPPPIVGQGGFGDGKFGVELFGTPRDTPDRNTVATPTWTLDNWGEELRAMASADGRLLRWSPQSPTDNLTAVTNAPLGRTFVVTPERHVMIFGAGGDASRFEWSDEENDTEWTPGVLTKAGGYNVEPRSPIMSARVTAAGVMFNTARMAYLVQHIGVPYVYGYSKVGSCPPPLSAQAIIEVPEGLMWLSVNGFWVFNGVGAYPVESSVWEWVRKNINIDLSKYYAAAIPNPAKFEVWFCFVSSESDKNDKIVTYNYAQRIWYMSNLSRLCGVAFQSDANPLMSDGDIVYRHESGYEYPDAPEMPWADTYTINNVNGSLKTTLKQMLPEIIGDRSAVRFRFYMSNDPTRQSKEILSDAKMIRSNGYVDIRETARDFRMRIEMTAARGWSLGLTQMDMVARGQK